MTPFVDIKKLDPHLPTPSYQTTGAAGMDLYAVENGWVAAGGSKVVSVGISVAIPHGYKGVIAGRSGMGFRDEVVPFPGTIDSDYRGEIKVKLFNLGKFSYFFDRGARICQLCILPAPQALVKVVEEVSISQRGENGFGSTGK